MSSFKKFNMAFCKCRDLVHFMSGCLKGVFFVCMKNIKSGKIKFLKSLFIKDVSDVGYFKAAAHFLTFF